MVHPTVLALYSKSHRKLYFNFLFENFVKIFRIAVFINLSFLQFHSDYKRYKISNTFVMRLLYFLILHLGMILGETSYENR